MAQTPVDRLVELSMVPELAKEVRNQISAGSMSGLATTVANAAAAPTQAEFNALLTALRGRGVIS